MNHNQSQHIQALQQLTHTPQPYNMNDIQSCIRNQYTMEIISVLNHKKHSYQLNENSTEFSFFVGLQFFTLFLKMVLLVAPLSLFRWFFDILNSSIHNVYTFFFKCLFFIYFHFFSIYFFIFFYSMVFLVIFPCFFQS
jgi:hypothetical protein